MKRLSFTVSFCCFLVLCPALCLGQDDSSSQLLIEAPVKAAPKVAATKMLWDFEDAADLKDFAAKGATISVNEDEKFVKSGKKSLQIEISGEAQWPGVFVGEHETTKTKENSDWSGDFNALRFDMFNTLNETVQLCCRIDDQKSSGLKSRYNGDVILKPGWNTVAISYDYLRYGEGKAKSGKKIDLKNIKLFCIFSSTNKDMLLYLDNIRLDKLVQE